MSEKCAVCGYPYGTHVLDTSHLRREEFAGLYEWVTRDFYVLCRWCAVDVFAASLDGETLVRIHQRALSSAGLIQYGVLDETDEYEDDAMRRVKAAATELANGLHYAAGSGATSITKRGSRRS